VFSKHWSPPRLKNYLLWIIQLPHFCLFPFFSHVSPALSKWHLHPFYLFILFYWLVHWFGENPKILRIYLAFAFIVIHCAWYMLLFYVLIQCSFFNDYTNCILIAYIFSFFAFLRVLRYGHAILIETGIHYFVYLYLYLSLYLSTSLSLYGIYLSICTGVWKQHLGLARQALYHLSHTASPEERLVTLIVNR
jgi:hypothetical protein